MTVCVEIWYCSVLQRLERSNEDFILDVVQVRENEVLLVGEGGAF